MKFFIPSVLCVFVTLSLASAAKSNPQRGSEKPDLHMGIFTENCTTCHDLTKVAEAHKTKTNAEMREILRSHKDRDGFQVTEQDLNTILKLY